MIRPQISKAACQDLDAIAEYFLTRNIDAGERFFQEFNQKCKYLVNFPFIGKSYPSISNGLRGLPTHVTQKLTKALTPSPSPAGEGNKKIIEILLPFSRGRRGWGMRADLRSA